MRDLKNKLTTGKNTRNIQRRKGKSFGYQVLGFGAGGGGAAFICATGGTTSTCGDYKIHTFTSPGTFCVSKVAACAAENVVSYLVVAGGAEAVSAVEALADLENLKILVIVILQVH